ncbi:shikimate dehydrogenase family protein [Pseudosulfitobacter koreensis]|uniref:NAD(P)-binding domain-containing protein n=1 Tax=Pseudosulfitobacter koreensis TaxID=2968472 RepID=A0ABT1Z3J2_9RHOB|nr:NAD(P)-binding domain-containing protein [Pseudosulfitobacter koreense]
MSRAPSLQLGLIGDNIAASRAPMLHGLAGTQNGIAVRYDRLVPHQRDMTFDQLFDHCAGAGYRGLNITYPYKERAVARVRIDDPLVRAIGAVNTVIFDAGGPTGFNTDYSGFMAACTAARGTAPLGAVLMIGTGGVGRAVAFGLVGLGVTEVRLVDRDPDKAQALARALHDSAPQVTVSVHADAVEAASGVSGVINCTPVGMVGYGGTPLPRAAMAGIVWAFDAVYTPTDTQFLKDAAAEGLEVISGWELFFYQGVHAWDLFSGTPLDRSALRQALNPAEDG